MLPFDAEVLTALVEQYNRAIWPAQIAAILLALVALVLVVRPVRGAGRLIGLIVTSGWIFTGAVFHLQFFAPLNFAAPVYGWCFLAQAMLLLWTLVLRGGTSFRLTSGFATWAGLILAFLALVLMPLGEAGLGAGLSAVELPGLAPDPTVVFTLALLLMVNGRAPLHLIALPLLWSLVAAGTAWMLEAPGAMVLPAAGIIGTILIGLKGRRTPD